MRVVDLTRSQLPRKLETRLRVHGTDLCTRIDAPSLLIKGGKTIDQFPPDRLLSKAVLLDLTHKKSRELIDDEDLEGAEERAGLALREGEAVILQTGWEDFAGHREYSSNHAGLSKNGAQYLEFKGIRLVGVDAPNLDHPSNRKLPAHRILLRREILVVENLCNLTQLQKSRFRLIALPPRITAPSSYVRAIAIVDG